MFPQRRKQKENKVERIYQEQTKAEAFKKKKKKKKKMMMMMMMRDHGTILHTKNRGTTKLDIINNKELVDLHPHPNAGDQRSDECILLLSEDNTR